MEHCIIGALNDITYMPELIPTATRKFGTNFRSVLLTGQFTQLKEVQRWQSSYCFRMKHAGNF